MTRVRATLSYIEEVTQPFKGKKYFFHGVLGHRFDNVGVSIRVREETADRYDGRKVVYLNRNSVKRALRAEMVNGEVNLSERAIVD